MASTPSPSTPGSKYDVTSRISELLDKYFSSMPPVSAPSAVFTSGPNQGLPVAAMPPSATPFRQKSGPRRVSKVTAETARARSERAGRPAKLAERFARNAPKPPSLLAREEPVPTKAKPAAKGPRPAPYSTRKSKVSEKGTRPMLPPGVGTETPSPEKTGFRGATPYNTFGGRRPVSPSALSETLGRINAAPVSSIYQGAPGLTREDYRQAQEMMDRAQEQRAFDIGYATQARQLGEEDVARAQAAYRQSDLDFANRMAELDKDALAKHLAAQKAARRAASAFGVARESADAMGRYVPFDPLASFGRMIGFGQ